jgi:RHS repeat-associated protein
MGNTTAVTSMDLRVLAPTAITDHNANITEACFDAFGLTIATALRGKGNQGDSLTGFDTALANPDRDAQRRLFVTDYDETEPRRLLAGATARYAYYFGDDIIAGVLTWAAHPAAACAILRDTHEAALAGGATSPVQAAFEYTDGLGAVIVKKTLAEPDPAVAGQARRWIATGKTIRNNKGSAVKQYEPYFTAHHRFEEPQEVGVTPILYYDAPGRLVRTELPDGTFSRVDFGPWRAAHWDANDTVKESRWYAERGSPDPAAPLQAGASGDTRAAWLAARHAGTPALTFFDSLGRDVVAVADLGIADANGRSKYVTLTKLDVEGKPLWIVDARGNVVMRYTLPATPGGDPLSDYVTAYDIAGTLLFQHSMDAGDRWMLPDAGGKPLLAWDRNGSSAAAHDDRLFLTQYDLLHRPVAQWLSTTGGAGQQIERLEYCDTAGNATLAADQQNNLLGKPRKHYDPSGLTELVRVDFKGNTAEIRRTLTNQYDHSAVDWQQPQGKLEAETYASMTEFDALSRPVRIFNWHRLGTGSRVAVYTPRYNERGLLVGEQLEIGSVTTANGYTPPAAGAVMAVAEVRYDAKGQKTSLALGNGTLTRYAYDRDTFRLTQMVTTRTNAATTPPFPQYHAALSDANTLQQLSYTYDAVGNITEITDEAFAPVFFQNRAVDARNRYEYDALYRLIRASGRENGASIGPPRYVEGAAPRVQFPVMTADPQAQRRYTQSFAYDEVGNVMQIQHAAGIGSWTRQFTPDTASNRLLASQDGGATPVSYRGDLHGNMLNLAGTSPAQDLRWDFRDMIASVDLAGGGRAYYAYDSGKQRTRKRLVRATGSGGIEDRVYLGGYERYRRYAPGNTTTPVEEIESHHLLEGDERVLLVDDVVRASGRSYPRSDGLTVPAQTLFRYQYGNHLGSACLELDEQVRIISYEEYHPYGTSAYWLVDATVEAPPKRYRYTGMERDEETGLSYHGARYYVPGLIRWVSADPAGIQEGVNVFRPLLTNPIAFRDTTGRQPDIPVKLPERFYRPGALLGVCRDKVPSVTAEDVRDRRDDGPQMYAADPAWLVASKSANSVFPPKQQEIFEQTIRGPVVAAAAPGVAVAAGALGIAHGTYYLATGDYEKAMAAYAFSLEFLPNVSTEFALTANQRMSLAIKESQFLLEREYVQASLANQAAAHTLHTNVALTVTQARARADELASFVLDKGMADLSKAQASREFGPVASVAVDTQTGEYGVGLNIQRGRGLPPTDAEMQNLRESLHPVLRARFDALQAHAAELVRTGQVTDDVARAGVAGTHSEFIALNNAIKAREALTGVAVTADDLADFVIVNRGLVGPFAGQNMPPPCYNCSILIRGTTMGQ